MSFTDGSSFQLSLNETSIEQNPAYYALSSFIADLTQDKTINNPLSEENMEKLNTLINNLLNALSMSIYGTNITEETTKKEDSVFKLLSFSISLLKDKSEASYLKKKLSDIENENCDLIKQVADLENEKSVQGIAKQLGIYGAITMDDLVEQVQDLRESKNKLISDLIEAFDLSPLATPLNIVSMLKSKIPVKRVTFAQQDSVSESSQQTQSSYNSDNRDDVIAELEAEIRELKSRYAASEHLVFENEALQASLEEAKSDIASLQMGLAKTHKKEEKKRRHLAALKQEIGEIEENREQLQTTNESLVAQVEQLKKIVSEQPKKSTEIEQLNRKLANVKEENNKLLSLIDEFSDQFQAQQEELEQESKDRSSLVTAIHKLSIMNRKLELLLEKEQKSVASLKQSRAVEKQAEKDFIKEDSALGIVTFMSQSVAECKNFGISEKIGSILDKEEENSEEKVKNAVEKLIEIINEIEQPKEDESEKFKEQNEKLVSGLVASYKFIDTLIDNNSVSYWEPMQKSSVDDLREAIAKEATKVNDFIKENANGFIEESNFYDFLVEENSAIDFNRKISDVFSKYPKLETDEGRDVFILLAQSLIANEVLRKYAKEAKIQCNQQSFDVKVVKKAAEEARKEIESQHAEEVERLQNEIEEEKQKYEQLVETTSGIKTVLQNATARSIDIKEVVESIEKINENVPQLNQNEYVAELEKIYSEKCTELASIKEENNAEIEELRNQLADLQKKHEEALECEKNTKEAKTREVEEFEKNLNNTEEHLQKLQEENAQLKKQVEEAKDEVVNQTADLRRQIISSKTKIDALQDKYDIAMSKAESEKNQLVRKLNEASEKISYIKAQCKIAIKKKVTAVIARFDDEENKNREVIAKQEETINSLNNSLSEMETVISELKENLEDIKEESKEKDETITKLQFDQKIMSTKLASKEEKIKRDKSLFETQMRLKLFAIETDTQARIDTCRSEASKAIEILLQDIFNIVNSSFELSNKDESIEPIIDEESVKNMVEEVCEKAKQYYELEKKLNTTTAEIEAIKAATGINSTSKIAATVSSYVKEIETQNQVIAKITEENNQMKKDIVHVRSAIQQEKVNKDWEDWARNINIMINDGMCSVKSTKEIKNSIEEVIHAAMNNRIVWRRLDTLRDEKKIILSGVHNVEKTKMQPSILPITKTIEFVLRIKKLATISKYASSFTTKNGEQRVKIENRENKTPIFSKFVRSSKQNENLVLN